MQQGMHVLHRRIRFVHTFLFGVVFVLGGTEGYFWLLMISGSWTVQSAPVAAFLAFFLSLSTLYAVSGIALLVVRRAEKRRRNAIAESSEPRRANLRLVQ